MNTTPAIQQPKECPFLTHTLIPILFLLLFLPSVWAQTAFEAECDRLAASREPDPVRLTALFKLSWTNGLRENPEFATDIGYAGHNDRWTDYSLEAIARRKRELHAPLKVIRSISRDNLGTADQLNYDLFRRNHEVAIEGARFPGEYLAINQLSGAQQGPAQTLELAPRGTVNDYRDILARLNGLPALIDQNIVLLEKGLGIGVTTPRITLRDVPGQVKAQMEPAPDKNPLLVPFREFPAGISALDRERLRAEAAAVLREKIIPAYNRLYAFLADTYIPRARETVALNALPQGNAWYEYAVRASTTTSLTPAQIHQIGLAEVKRLRAEMDAVIAHTGFEGDLNAFTAYLRTNAQFYYQSKDELLCGYRCIAKRLDPELIRFFGTLPRLPYGVLPVPAYAEKSQPTAYYQSGSLQAGRPAAFYANTYALETRPKWEMEALTAHEAVPGHHLQIALAQEMPDAPEFRKYSGYTAFVEGWGLYAEALAEEMGLYRDRYSKYGQLTYEMWRAIRLVVDTGIHSMGWTRQQAIDFFLANSSKGRHDVTVEVDRYIVWPGQALAYKIGEMKLKELRANAARELGDQFNIRSFHDQILASGAVPLDVLEGRVKDWVRERKRSG